MSKPVYQYMQGYSPMGGETFHFWVDCTKEFYGEEKQEGGTVRVLYDTQYAEDNLRQSFEEAVILISCNCADLSINIKNEYDDPQIQVFWENAQRYFSRMSK